MSAPPTIPAPEPARTPPARRPGRIKRILFASLAIALAALLPLVTFFVYAFFVQYRIWEAKQPRVHEATENWIARRDPRVGWTPIAGFAMKDVFGPGKDLHINRDGVRGARETPRQAPAGRRRALCLGDSFMFGLFVGDGETFPAQLEPLAGIEALNLGMPGYGLDQALLRYEAEMDRFEHQLVIVGLITDDLRRMLTDRGAFGYYKPRFVLEGGALELTGVPTPPPLAVGEILYPETRWQFIGNRYPPLRRFIPARLLRDAPNPQDDPEISEPLAQRILTDFQKLCFARGKQLVVVWLPTWQDFKIEPSCGLYRTHHAALSAFARARGITLLDLTTMMENAVEAEFAAVYMDEENHHPRPEGYRRFAEKTARMLKLD